MKARITELFGIEYPIIQGHALCRLCRAGGVYPKVMLDGNMDATSWSRGMLTGLIHDVPTREELIHRVMVEADSIISERLGGMAQTRQAA